MNTIAILGASGFIGKQLVATLLRLGGFRIKILSRNPELAELNGLGVEMVQGDLMDPASLRDFLESGCTVINLVYFWGTGESKNLAASRNLLAACKYAGIRRLIHCSTAAVVGRVPDNRVTEYTQCRPVSEYGITKLKIENAVLDYAKDNFDAVILRPTAVFGQNGEALKKLAGDLMSGRWLRNYLKSCLFNSRRMNLVCIENVSAAIIFLVGRTEKLKGEIFIVSDDDSPANNFADVERFLMQELGVRNYKMPRLPMPPKVLAFLLSCLGRNNVNPCCNYAPDKLLNLGFERPVSFEAGLAEYAAWYRRSRINGQREVAA